MSRCTSAPGWRTRTDSPAAAALPLGASRRAGAAPARSSRPAGRAPPPARRAPAGARRSSTICRSASREPMRVRSGDRRRGPATPPSRPRDSAPAARYAVARLAPHSHRRLRRRDAVQDQPHQPTARLPRVPHPTRRATLNHPGLRRVVALQQPQDSRRPGHQPSRRRVGPTPRTARHDEFSHYPSHIDPLGATGGATRARQTTIGPPCTTPPRGRSIGSSGERAHALTSTAQVPPPAAAGLIGVAVGGGLQMYGARLERRERREVEAEAPSEESRGSFSRTSHDCRGWSSTSGNSSRRGRLTAARQWHSVFSRRCSRTSSATTLRGRRARSSSS